MKNTNTQPTILANTTVIKRKEYSMSYGAPETLKYPFIKEFDNLIMCLNSEGEHMRTFRKGTKLLILFNGKKISERTFQKRVLQNKESIRQMNLEREVILQRERQEIEIKESKIVAEMSSYFTDIKIDEIKHKLATKNSKECKNYYKMKSIQLTGTHHNWHLVYKSIFG